MTDLHWFCVFSSLATGVLTMLLGWIIGRRERRRKTTTIRDYFASRECGAKTREDWPPLTRPLPPPPPPPARKK